MKFNLEQLLEISAQLSSRRTQKKISGARLYFSSCPSDSPILPLLQILSLHHFKFAASSLYLCDERGCRPSFPASRAFLRVKIRSHWKWLIRAFSFNIFVY